MSKIIYLNLHNKNAKDFSDKLYQISKMLGPDNIEVNAPHLYQGTDTLFSVINPLGTVGIKNKSILLGHCTSDGDWSIPRMEIADGSYALIRGDDKVTEIVVDSVASRTLWYYHDTDFFIVSTSQRAIVLFLENFEFNEKIIPWILSTGSLGPDLSWDRRIQKIRPGSSVVLDKESWKLGEQSTRIAFSEKKRNLAQHKKVLLQAITSSFKNFSFDPNKWVIPLSGGYDSRAILYLIKEAVPDPAKIRSITWGLTESINKEETDAYVAQKVAEATGIQHKYYHTDISDDPINVILKRFIENGEGRIDHISGYTDGFAIWKTLFEDGIEGIVRGDEGFGWVTTASSLRVRYHLGCAYCTDYSNLMDYRKYGIPDQEIPEYMEQGPSESLNSWRDRLYHQYRIPTIISALSDLKLGYVEQSTPLLSDNIIGTVRTLPDHLRTEKLLFKKIMGDFKPWLSYATSRATASPKNILKSEEMVNYLKKELRSTEATVLFSPEFLDWTANNARISKGDSFKPSLRQQLHLLFIRFAPQWVKNRVASNQKLALDPNILLFRVYIIIYMYRLLSRKPLV